MSKLSQINTNKHDIEDLSRRVKGLEEWRRALSIRMIKSRSLELGNEAVLPVLPVVPKPIIETPLNSGLVEEVYPKLVAWLLEPSNKRVGSWSKFFSVSNDVRQLLFERNRKAIEKYGEGLRMDQGPSGLAQAQHKLADAIFFLFKFCKSLKPPDRLTEKVERENAIKRVDELIVLLQSLSTDLKKSTLNK